MGERILIMLNEIDSLDFDSFESSVVIKSELRPKEKKVNSVDKPAVNKTKISNKDQSEYKGVYSNGGSSWYINLKGQALYGKDTTMLASIREWFIIKSGVNSKLNFGGEPPHSFKDCCKAYNKLKDLIKFNLRGKMAGKEELKANLINNKEKYISFRKSLDKIHGLVDEVNSNKVVKEEKYASLEQDLEYNNEELKERLGYLSERAIKRFVNLVDKEKVVTILQELD